MSTGGSAHGARASAAAGTATSGRPWGERSRGYRGARCDRAGYSASGRARLGAARQARSVGTNKHPLTTHGLLDATTDERTITDWWSRRPDANIAIRTGAPSGLVVLDVDEAGAGALHELERKHGALPITASVKTPRGGSHYYLRHPGQHVKTTAGALAPGLDVRGDGGYVLVPPSVGPNGQRYTWDEEAPPADMPAWLIEATRETATNGKAAEPASTWVRIVRDGLPNGERNSGLARIVGHLLSRDLDAHLVAELAHLINTRARPPLSPAEVDRIVTSIAGCELRKRARTGR